MKMDLENESALKSYLLGDLNPDEQEHLEQRLMADTEVFEELHRIEDELIDDYLEGGLSGRERERFENFFLTAPERKQKLSFAKSLKQYVAAHKPKKSTWAFWPKPGQALWPTRSPVLKWALAASLMFLIGGGFWSTVQISRLQIALDQKQEDVSESQRLLRETQNQSSKITADLEDEKARSSRLEQEVADLKKDQKPGPSLLPGLEQAMALVVSLDPGKIRDSGDNQGINVPPGEGWVQLDLKMEPMEYPRYRITLVRAGGDIIRTQTESSIQGYFPGLCVPAELLTQGDYELSLSGITAAGDIKDIETYYFTVNSE